MLGRPNKICVSKFIDLMTTSIQELLNDFQSKRNKKSPAKLFEVNPESGGSGAKISK